MARCARPLRRHAWWVRSISTIWNPMVYTGFSAVIGSWKMTAISLPRIRAQCCGVERRPVRGRRA